MREIEILRKMGACEDAVGDGEENRGWLEDQQDYETAWNICPRGDWMLWLLRRVLNLEDEIELRKLTLVKARCAKKVFHQMKDERSRNAVIIAEKFGNGEATREELTAAAADAPDAYADAYAAAAAAAAADAAADADIAAALYAVYAVKKHSERMRILFECADEVRKIFPQAPKLNGVKQ